MIWARDKKKEIRLFVKIDPDTLIKVKRIQKEKGYDNSGILTEVVRHCLKQLKEG